MVLIFENIFNEILVSIFYLGILVYFLILTIKDRKNKNREIKEIERKSYRILWISIPLYIFFAGYISGYVFYLSNSIEFLRYFILPPIFIYIGIIISAIGLFIYIWGKISLGRYYSHVVSVYKDHRVIDKGPYKYIRHPMYLGSILILFGVPIVYRSLLSIPLIIIMIVIYNYRANIEEKLLIENLGEEYLNYKKKVKYKFIPYIF